MPQVDDQERVSAEILKEIRGRHLEMKSRHYFLFQAVLFLVGMAVLFLAILYLASLVAFGVLETGVWFVPAFGFEGWLVFFRSLPWLLIAATLFFVLVLEMMVRRYPIAYRRPLFYSMTGIVALVVISGFFVSRSHLHREVPELARQYHIRGVGRFYRDFGTPRFPNVHPGVIEEVTSDGFIIRERGGETSSILITSSTRLPFGREFMPMDTVVIFGDASSGIIRAFGVRRIHK